jgi:hypothetical protein
VPLLKGAPGEEYQRINFQELERMGPRRFLMFVHPNCWGARAFEGGFQCKQRDGGVAFGAGRFTHGFDRGSRHDKNYTVLYGVALTTFVVDHASYSTDGCGLMFGISKKVILIDR